MPKRNVGDIVFVAPGPSNDLGLIPFKGQVVATNGRFFSLEDEYRERVGDTFVREVGGHQIINGRLAGPKEGKTHLIVAPLTPAYRSEDQTLGLVAVRSQDAWDGAAWDEYRQALAEQRAEASRATALAARVKAELEARGADLERSGLLTFGESTTPFISKSASSGADKISLTLDDVAKILGLV